MVKYGQGSHLTNLLSGTGSVQGDGFGNSHILKAPHLKGVLLSLFARLWNSRLCSVPQLNITIGKLHSPPEKKSSKGDRWKFEYNLDHSPLLIA